MVPTQVDVTCFLTVPAIFKIFRIQEKPTYRSFFIVQNISNTINVFKNRGYSFFSYTKR